MASPFYTHTAPFDNTCVSYGDELPLINPSTHEKAVGLGLVDCETASHLVAQRPFEHALSGTWTHEGTMSSPVRLKVDTEDPWMYDLSNEPHLRQAWNTSNSFPTPTEYTSASSLISPATSRLTHSARTSISSVYEAHALTSCENFDSILASQGHIAPHLAWSAPQGTGILNYSGIHDLSILAPSPTTSTPEDYPAVFFSPHCHPMSLVPSSNPIESEYKPSNIAEGSAYSSDDTQSDSLMLQERPAKKRRKPTTEENAKFSCDICGKLFQRSHNLKMHHKTHDRRRFKEHKCPHRDCDKEFDRKADLVRHDDAVHLKKKRFKCQRCDARFPRKDTLQRHKADGCPKRHQLTNELQDPNASETAGHSHGQVCQSTDPSPILTSVSPLMSPLFQTGF